VLVVVPAWNEAEALPATLDSIRRSVPSLDVLVVDDGSSDGTGELARQAGADAEAASTIKVVTLPFNVGVGAAMRTGFLFAQRHGYTAVVQVDADGQHDPSDIPRLLERLDAGADVVIGARFAGTGDYDVRGPRRWAMRLLAGAVSRVARTPLTDVTSGFRASSSQAVQLFAREYPPEYLGDTVESLVLASRAGLAVAQVPVSMHPRQGGQPSQSVLRSTAYLGRAVLVLALSLLHLPRSKGDA
jgi:glycosyltransferase involved in cell wall biosynthesis